MGSIIDTERLPGEVTPRPLLRYRYKKASGIPDQQLYVTGSGDCPTLQMSLADRTVFQMDQATLENQGILWHYRKRSENSNLDCHLGLCARSHPEKAPQYRPQSLHNSTDFERYIVRENAHFTSSYKEQLQRYGGYCLQPVEFIQLTLGQ